MPKKVNSSQTTFQGVGMENEVIFEKVSAILVQALNVDPEEVKLESMLQKDLRAEDIDYLDIVFRLERELGIKIPRSELFTEEAVTRLLLDISVGRIVDYLAARLAIVPLIESARAPGLPEG